MSFPVIECEPAGNGLWRFWCPHCNTYHRHGGPPDANGRLGHRGAHCFVTTSPYLKGGYILRVASKTNDASRRKKNGTLQTRA
jgi:hypothetical protein